MQPNQAFINGTIRPYAAYSLPKTLPEAKSKTAFNFLNKSQQNDPDHFFWHWTGITFNTDLQPLTKLLCVWKVYFSVTVLFQQPYISIDYFVTYHNCFAIDARDKRKKHFNIEAFPPIAVQRLKFTVYTVLASLSINIHCCRVREKAFRLTPFWKFLFWLFVC